MPRSLHGELAAAAEREQVSLNQFITGVLAAAVRWRDANPPSGPEPGPHAVMRAVEPLPGAGPARRSKDLARRSALLLSLALTVNAVLLAVAAVVAIALLLAAW
jgi:hypothetical protein